MYLHTTLKKALKNLKKTLKNLKKEAFGATRDFIRPFCRLSQPFNLVYR
jgi:hypothetical protein